MKLLNKLIPLNKMLKLHKIELQNQKMKLTTGEHKLNLLMLEYRIYKIPTNNLTNKIETYKMKSINLPLKLMI